MSNFKLVSVDNFHEIVPEYIKSNKIIISEYEDMTNVILNMIKAKYFFNMDKNLLRGFMEDLVFMYSPNDDMNKDRIVSMLEPSDDEDDEKEFMKDFQNHIKQSNQSDVKEVNDDDIEDIE